jgi:LacI family transcriptional regulator
MAETPESSARPENYVTMKDVADAVGVSKMTVSRALKGNQHGVAEPTRKRIEEAAERLGYRRNPMVQSLMSQVRRRKTTAIVSEIAAIVQHSQCPAAQVGWRQNSIPIILDSIRSTAARNGFRLEVLAYKQQSRPRPHPADHPRP